MAVTTMDGALARAEQDFDGAVERLCELLRIPSISTDPAYNAETQRAADHLVHDLRQIGFAAEARPTPKHPMVVAHHEGPPGYDGPRLLYYGHYDVQPPDPLELWDSPPFEPVIVEAERGPRVVARGAVDDKGQLMMFVEAFRAWANAEGTLPAAVTVLLEGEEESGSPSLEPFMRENREDLAADVCVVSDTGMWDFDTPAITYSLRGLCYIEATLHGPAMDLHSGLYGGAVVNPINELCRIIGELHDAERRVMIPGFYDDVIALGSAEREQWKSLNADDATFLGNIGLKTPYGEAGYTSLERTWARPTCDVNGIFGGYTGAGAKTVIGECATAKISCRLVADQDPQKIHDALVAFLEARTPPDCRWEIESHGVGPAIRVPTDSPFLKAATDALRDTCKRDAVLIGSGGSIPAVGAVQEILGIDSLLIGFGLDDDRMHSPNEKFELACYRRGIESHVRLLGAVGAMRR